MARVTWIHTCEWPTVVAAGEALGSLIPEERAAQSAADGKADLSPNRIADHLPAVSFDSRELLPEADATPEPQPAPARCEPEPEPEIDPVRVARMRPQEERAVAADTAAAASGRRPRAPRPRAVAGRSGSRVVAPDETPLSATTSGSSAGGYSPQPTPLYPLPSDAEAASGLAEAVVEDLVEEERREAAANRRVRTAGNRSAREVLRPRALRAAEAQRAASARPAQSHDDENEPEEQRRQSPEVNDCEFRLKQPIFYTDFY